MRSAVFLTLVVAVAAFHPLWKNKAPWHEADDLAEEKKASEKFIRGNMKMGKFPLHPRRLQVADYKWSKREQRVAVETSEGSVYFRTYIAQEVFAAQLAEYLGLCVSKVRRIPWGSAVSHAWQDVIQDVTQSITPENVARVQYLFEDQIGVQEMEFIDGAQVAGYEANRGYERILFEIGKIFGFDMFLNDPNNCRHKGYAGTGWTCKDDNVYNFIISPNRGVCGNSRAYHRMDMNNGEGIKFQEFFHMAHHSTTNIELSKSLAYIAGEMFGESLTMDRREVAEALLKGARWTMKRLVQVEEPAFTEIGETSGLHESFGFGLGERVRMLRIIANMEIQDPSYLASLELVDEAGATETDQKEDAEQENKYEGSEINGKAEENQDEKEAGSFIATSSRITKKMSMKQKVQKTRKRLKRKVQNPAVSK